jgi:hypothetical protein
LRRVRRDGRERIRGRGAIRSASFPQPAQSVSKALMPDTRFVARTPRRANSSRAASLLIGRTSPTNLS